VRRDLLAFVADWPADDELHVTGLPVAEDTFGVEMFYQMAISAPLAMLVIFLLMWWFFGHLLLVISPMIVALLIISGNTLPGHKRLPPGHKKTPTHRVYRGFTCRCLAVTRLRGRNRVNA